MAYIIENANVLRDDQVDKMSLLIKDERIAMLRATLKSLSFIRFDAQSFLMSPTHIVYKANYPSSDSFQEMKTFYIQEFIKKGSTMFLTYVDVEKEYLFTSAYKKIKKRLLNCPIDYAIGVKVPIHLISTNFIRKCKREKIPAVFVEVTDASQLEKVPWGWIREAMFPYNCPLIPIFNVNHPRKRKRLLRKWKEVLNKEKIPFIEQELIEDEPIAHSHLCKLGIYPVKLGLHQGGEVSYNLYRREDIQASKQSELYLEFQDSLLFTVHKGTVIRANEEVLFRPGYGEHVIINIPSFFTKE